MEELTRRAIAERKTLNALQKQYAEAPSDELLDEVRRARRALNETQNQQIIWRQKRAKSKQPQR